MDLVMPRFRYRYVEIENRRVLCIEEDGEIIHEVRNVRDFYQMFGYQPESLHPDMLPDEFIWFQYVNNTPADFTSRIQRHIMEYLKLHSEAFNRKYGAIYDRLIAIHEAQNAKRGASCFACKRCGTGGP